MKHTCTWHEDKGCAVIKLYGEVTPEEGELLMDELELVYADSPKKRLMIDHTESPRAISRQTREVFERRGTAINHERLAFFGMNNLNRIVARIVLSLLGQSDTTQFFATEAEALAWINRT